MEPIFLSFFVVNSIDLLWTCNREQTMNLQEPLFDDEV